MANLLHQIHYSASLNMTPAEVVFLAVLAVLAWLGRKKLPWLPLAYSVFLILHITLFRRAPGYDETIHLTFRFFKSAGLWAGNLLNLVLYVPFGWTAQKYLRGRKRTAVVVGLLLSACCEGIQYGTSRGCADVNDILFNTLGTLLGTWLAGLL